MKSNTESSKNQLIKRLLNQASPRQSINTVKKQETNSRQSINEIKRVPDQSYYPASFAQKRMFLLHQFQPLSVGYNLPLAMVIEGNIDFQRFQSAVNQLVERHESLRTGVRMIDDNIVQVIEQDVQITVNEFKISESEILELMKQFSQPFDISKPSLARVAIAELGIKRHLLLIDIHHIVADGISLQVILRDLMSFYNGALIQPLRLRYRDYAAWQEQWFESENAKSLEEYWLKQFEDNVPLLDLPTDFLRPDFLADTGSHLEFSFSKEDTESLKRLAKNLGVTDYTLMLGIFSVFLAKFSGQDDIVVGSPVAGRRHSEIQDIVGMFVNTVAIRCFPYSTKKFSEYIKELGGTVLSAIDSQEYPFEAIVEKTGVTRDINRNPLFDVMFSMLNMKKTTSIFNDITITSYPFERRIANFDLELYMTEENYQMHFRVEYNSLLFLKNTVQQIIQYFQYITQQLIENPYIEISSITLLNQVEQSKVLERHRGTEVIDNDLVFTEVFEEHVRKTPNALAVICENRSLTYSELSAWSNKVANGLLELGVHDEELVTLWLDRDIEFLVSMLGVFKSAAAYVPVDPTIPNERIKTILEESNSRLIVTESKYANIARELAGRGVKIVLIEELISSNYSVDKTGKKVSPSNLAYVIFTSGSTGKPKGAMVEHRGMLNHILAKVEVFGLVQTDKVAETATQSFDVSVWQFLTALAVGGTTVVFKGVNAWQPKPLLEGIREHGVTIFETVPSHLILLLDEIEETLASDTLPLRWIMLNGELLLSEICRRWFKFYPNIPIINAYGPTECSDDVTHYIVSNTVPIERSSIPISGTVAGMRIYILDENLNQVPRGVVGELYVGGVGVGRGYLSDPVKTASAFLPDIFSKEPGKRMYRTGDLVRELADDSIEFLGRSDHQVKINGVRIELNEIEHAILATGMVREIVVVAGNWKSGKGKQLCAYTVLKPGDEIDVLKFLIEASLPSYMVPTYWVTLENLPLLINGKVNRKDLPKPDLNIFLQKEFIEPETDNQRFIAKLWCDVLDLKESNIGLHHDFFQLGGTSLKAMKLVSKIKSQSGIELPFTAIFSAPLLGEFVELFIKAEENNNFKIEPLSWGEEKEIPTLYEHQRILKQTMKIPNTVVFNMPYQSVIEGDFDVKRAETAFHELYKRHWMMSANFTYIESKHLVLQTNSEATTEFSAVKSNEDYIPELWEQFVKEFEVHQGPLFRMKVITINPNRHYLFFDNHTLSSDFTSKRLLIRDFINFYLGKKMEPLVLNYPDYIHQRLTRVSDSIANGQNSLWEREFVNGVKRLVSKEAENLTSKGPEHANRVVFELNEKLLSKINTISKTYGLSEHSVCMAAFSLSLYKHFKQDHFYILSPITDREIPGFEDIVGLLFDTIPVPQKIVSEGTFANHMLQTHQNSIKAYSKRDYPAIKIYDELVKSDMGWAKGLFDATFVWVEASPVDFERVGFTVKEILNEKPMARFDLRLEAFRGENSLKLILEYRESLFSSQTIKKLMEHIISGLEFMVTKTSEKISNWEQGNG